MKGGGGGGRAYAEVGRGASALEGAGELMCFVRVCFLSGCIVFDGVHAPR